MQRMYYIRSECCNLNDSINFRHYEKLLKSKDEHEQKVAGTMRKADSINQTMESVNKQRKQYKAQIKKEEEKLVELKKVRGCFCTSRLSFSIQQTFSLIYRSSLVHNASPISNLPFHFVILYLLSDSSEKCLRNRRK